MERETFQVEFVTPGFLAGAAKGAEWRGASIRGQLRWWFRAVAGGRWKGDLGRVRREEAKLFGSTDRKSLVQVQALGRPASTSSGFGRQHDAKELARLWGDESIPTQDRLRISKDGREVRSDPVQYLAFGPIAVQAGKIVVRPYFPAESSAAFRLLWPPEAVDKETRDTLAKALWAWLNLGGLGAKNRKGFGSLRCKEPNKLYRGPANREELLTEARALLRESHDFEEIPAWSHFSSRSRILVATRAADSWVDAMEWLGAWLIGFRRRYGFPGDSRTLAGKPLANRDYEWASPKGRSPRREVPDRAGFGLPLPFRRNVNGVPRGETVIWGANGNGNEKDARRASPLLLHVSQFGRLFVPVLTYLPAEFLPAGARLRFQNHSSPSFAMTAGQQGIIEEFLADLLKKRLIQEVIP
jgi:CRISPR type III-B/RAMP module RAMP protein Cmr1